MLPASYATPAAIIFAVGGLLTCFAGYRLFRYVLGIYGFYAGAMITTSMVGGGSTWALVVAALVGGVVGAALMIAAFFLGVGLIGAGLAALGLNLVWRLIGGDPPTVVLVIVCVVGALFALSFARYVIVFGTAIAGAWTLIVGGMSLMGDAAAARATATGDVWVLYPLNPQPGQWWLTALWFALSLGGVIVQLATSKKKKKGV